MSSQELLKDKYEPLERIGNGAFGEIYKGTNTSIRSFRPFNITLYFYFLSLPLLSS